jgi:hypothetical protein
MKLHAFKSQISLLSVIPAKAGIQEKHAGLDPGFRRGDDFLRSGHFLGTYFPEAHNHSAAATPQIALKKSTKTGVKVPNSRPIIPLFN